MRFIRFNMTEGRKFNKEELDLIKKAQKGEADSFAALYDKYLNPIYRFIFLKVTLRQEAEDICQQVFLNAWKNINNFVPRQPFSSWLYRIARNAVIDHWRAKKIVFTLENPNIQENLRIDFNPAFFLDKEIQIKKVWEALNQLNQDQQDVIIMRFIEDLSHQEIAKVIDKTEGAVKVIQHRAIKSLKKILENERI